MTDEAADITKVDQPDFGIRIKNLRRDNDLSQRGLAEKIGRSEDSLNAIERGKNWVSRTTMKRLAKAFDMPERSLMDFAGNKAFVESGGLRWRASRKASHLLVRKKRVDVLLPRE